MLPFLEVSHLPSSASFYSAVLQPLGLIYVSHVQPSELTPPASSSSAETGQQSTITITYGTASFPVSPVLQLRQVQLPKRSHTVFAVSSPSVVAEFRATAFRANPALIGPSRPGPATINPDAGGEICCHTTDLDSNTIDVVYMPSASHDGQEAGSDSGLSTSRPTQGEPGRIISWNYDIAGYEGNPTSALIPVPEPSNPPPLSAEPYTVLRRSVTTSTIEEVPRASSTSTDNGSSATAILGAVLGAAAGAFAGAALTYGVMKSERERAPRQEFGAPPVTRRATFPDHFPDHRAPAPALYGGGGGGGDARYVEVERTVEKIRYPEQYAPIADHRPPPQYLAKYSQANAPATRALDDIYDDNRSHRSSRRGSRAPSTAAPESHRGQPLMLLDREHQSHVGSRHSATRPPSVRNQSYEPTDRDTYVSARSRRSTSTVKGPPPPTVETELAFRSRASSRAPTKAPSSRATSVREPTVVSVREPAMRPPSDAPSRAASKAASKGGPGSVIRMVGAHGGVESMPNTFPPNASRTPSHVSARHIGLPMSGVGSSHAGWDDDNVSVAPSDSISCVGSKTSHRRYNP